MCSDYQYTIYRIYVINLYEIEISKHALDFIDLTRIKLKF